MEQLSSRHVMSQERGLCCRKIAERKYNTNNENKGTNPLLVAVTMMWLHASMLTSDMT